MFLIFLLGCVVFCTLTNGLTVNKSSIPPKQHFSRYLDKSKVDPDFFNNEMNNQLDLNNMLSSRATNIRDTTSNERKATNQVYFEFARERPSLFSNNYDLVKEWYDRDENDDENFLLKNYPQPNLKSALSNYEKPKIDNKNNTNNLKIVDKIKTQKLHDKNGKNKSSGLTLADATERHKHRSTRRDRRRHAERNLDGWGWREGIFRETSRCVDIPRNMSLCSNIEYKFMRVPNLLAHDSLKEIIQQSSYWTPLARLKCHPDVRIFLCSLFAPVCLEEAIYPCRRTCQAVQEACEPHMKQYNFDWPEFLECSKFPADTDLCVGLRHEATDSSSNPSASVHEHECNMCGKGLTVEGFIDHFCEASVVLKASVQRAKEIQQHTYYIRLWKKRVRFIRGRDYRKFILGRRRRKIILEMANCDCGNVVGEMERLKKDGAVKEYNSKEAKMKMNNNKKYQRFLNSKKRIKNKVTSEEIMENEKLENKTRRDVRDSKQKNFFSFSSSSSSLSFSSTSTPQRYLIMMKMMGRKMVVMMMIPQDHPIVPQAMKVARNNRKSICSNLG